MRYFFSNHDSVLLWRVPSSEESVVRQHAFLRPRGFVLCQDIVNNIRTVDNVVVSCGDDLPVNQKLKARLKTWATLPEIDYK
jgi:hypothetical protein